jgi:hypothetical protein
MKVCTYNGLVIAILTRNEHCPPHVHVGPQEWDARFEFSFWHNGVRLWDVEPVQNRPTDRLLEAIRQEIKKPEHLRRARELWWQSRQTLCLENKQWVIDEERLASPQERRRDTRLILAGRFDADAYRTILNLEGETTPLEIQL